MSHLTTEQPGPRPNVKWRAGEIPQSPGESADGNPKTSVPAWQARPVAKSRKRK